MPTRMTTVKKTDKALKDLDKLELSHTADGSVRQCARSGKQFDSFLKSQLIIQHSNSARK